MSARRERGLWRATVQDQAGGAEETITARRLVNAAGPWVSDVLHGAMGHNGGARTRLVKGSHIVVKRLYTGDHAYLLQNPDNRVVFVIPYERDFSLIGTTDLPWTHDPGTVAITPDETLYLCESVSHWFERPVAPDDVVWSYAGVRPLHDDGATNASAVTRDYVLELDAPAGEAPSLSVFGGKITTYRKLAEAALAKLEITGALWTAGTPLPGGDIPDGDFARFVAELSAAYPFLPAPLVWRLARAYGTRATRILGTSKSLDDLGEDFGGYLTRAEVDYLVTQEFARSSARHLMAPLQARSARAGRHRAIPLAKDVRQCRVTGPATFVGAIDQGTTSTRFIVFDRAGEVVSIAQKEHAQYTPHPGWLEHDAEEIFRNVRETAAEALIRAGIGAADLAAIGITNQRETTVLWDRKTGKPLHRAIVWQDTRTDKLVAAFSKDGGKHRFSVRTGLPLASYFSALKLQWLLDNIPDARAKAEAGDALFGTIDTWLIWNLCGAHVTDVTNASRTQLMDLATLDWSPELLTAFHIPAACLARIVPSSQVAGEVSSFAGELAGVPIAALLGDQQAAMVGQVCFAQGEAKNTYGTGNFLLLNTGETPVASRHGLITTVAYQLAGQKACYALEGSIAITGALIQWLRDNLGIISKAFEADVLAASVPDNGGVYIVPAFAGLYAPHWREDARGVICGLTRYANRAHICRAALESTAYQTADVARAMEADSGISLGILRVDGGMVHSEPLMQFQSDILNANVVRPAVTETTALGAAYAAGLAVGVWSGPEELRALWRQDHDWQPSMSEKERSRLMQHWRAALQRSLDWA